MIWSKNLSYLLSLLHSLHHLSQQVDSTAHCKHPNPTWVKYAVGLAQYGPTTDVHLQAKLTLWLP